MLFSEERIKTWIWDILFQKKKSDQAQEAQNLKEKDRKRDNFLIDNFCHFVKNDSRIEPTVSRFPNSRTRKKLWNLCRWWIHIWEQTSLPKIYKIEGGILTFDMRTSGSSVNLSRCHYESICSTQVQIHAENRDFPARFPWHWKSTPSNFVKISASYLRHSAGLWRSVPENPWAGVQADTIKSVVEYHPTEYVWNIREHQTLAQVHQRPESPMDYKNGDSDGNQRFSSILVH